MKEDSKTKKATPKKTTKKTSTVKKSTSTKASVKKTTVKKEVAPKKRVISTVSKEALAPVEKEVVKEETTTYNKDLLLRVVLIIAYTLIIVILLIGFIEPYTNNLKVKTDYKPAYLVQQEIIDESHILTLENAKNRLGSLNGDYFVYVGYTKMYNGEVQVLDMGIANLIDKYGLKDKFYYLNIDSIINKKNLIAIVNSYLNYRDVLVNKVPTIIYVNSENIVRPENIITRDDDKLITVGDFQKLLDINQFVVKK